MRSFSSSLALSSLPPPSPPSRHSPASCENSARANSHCPSETALNMADSSFCGVSEQWRTLLLPSVQPHLPPSAPREPADIVTVAILRPRSKKKGVKGRSFPFAHAHHAKNGEEEPQVVNALRQQWSQPWRKQTYLSPLSPWKKAGGATPRSRRRVDSFSSVARRMS